MSSKSTKELHFLLIPFLAPGHTIPMIDMAKLLAQQEYVTVTIVTTPLNAIRYRPALNKTGLLVSFLELPFPGTEVGLPEGCESLDTLPSPNLALKFSSAVDMLQAKLEQSFDKLEPWPSCIVSDKYLPWTANIADKYTIPRIVFDGMSCFKQLCDHNLYESKVFSGLGESETFVVPGLPDRIELTRAQLPFEFNPSSRGSSDRLERVRETEMRSYGMVINSFEELEQEYVNEYKKLKRGKVWCIGPLSLCNDNEKDMAHRGKSDSISEQEILEWLDSHPHGSVVYACFGSVSRLTPMQLIELGLGLETSNHPFIWVIRAGDRAKEVEEWILESGFEERIKGKGLLIQGWAPQVLILSHPSIGGFVTHCGWNSTLEGVCAGVPMITWPQFAEQFLNEKLVVQVLGNGVGVGAEFVVHWGEEEKFGVSVKSKDVKEAILKVMDTGIEGVERRKKAKELGKLANGAIKEGGSSYMNLKLLIQDIREHANHRNKEV